MIIDSTHMPQYVAHGAIALFGAFVHALDANRKGRTKSFMDFVALTIMSSFSGVMFALIGLSLFEDQIYLTTAFAGTGGYLGVEGMSFIVDFIRRRFNP